ncbi:glycine N-acyltransferase-like protein 3 [Esox lucius]|uniref:Glycine N-acyltransferase-like protein n=1 Tax=Esox lucius TaxID=8010 RepID=A0A3P8Y6U8_ESOLU|nr:glycine N-acyltransferase-like protein 3 [Esox lucius]XP_010867739.2 glycine N-acyltransferase-like protein 3 [Esox lucius]XP_010867746.2 glycine N-acyltransferase-like protein 3 [Esox lucius]XP_019902748.2 glycine N-acyltransferase-like protein 3 [Esox lucius]
MKILNSDELRIAEVILRSHLPTCLKIYGFLYGINRNKPSTLEVVVDSWPDFNVIICRPDTKNKRVAEFMKRVSFFCMDEETFKKMVTEESAIDWSTYFLIGGVDNRHEPMLKEVSSSRGVNMKGFTLEHLMTLPDPSVLPKLDSDTESKVSPLNGSHIDLLNKNWKFGGGSLGYRTIKHLITHYPTGCITDDQGQPVCWILLYDYHAMGMLYTLPEHRGKGLARALVNSMSRRLYAEGFLVYCFIEEGNTMSHSLFTSLGFTEDPQYRAAWYQINYKSEGENVNFTI